MRTIAWILSAYDDEIVFEDELKAGGSKVYHVTPRSKSVLQSRKELDTIFKQTQYDVFWTNKTTISNIEALKIGKEKSGTASDRPFSFL